MSKDLLNISVQDTPLGMKWTLTIAGHTTDGGYAKSLWRCLDEANEAIMAQFNRALEVTKNAQ